MRQEKGRDEEGKKTAPCKGTRRRNEPHSSDSLAEASRHGLQAPVRKGVGSNPTAVTFESSQAVRESKSATLQNVLGPA